VLDAGAACFTLCGVRRLIVGLSDGRSVKRMKIASEEAFESQFQSFLEALRILEKPADVQCESMGNYNVAWESKDDLGVGAYILKDRACPFTEGQALAVNRLLRIASELPGSILVSATTAEAKRRAMSHPARGPLRRQAALLLRVLGKEEV
jgi:hypothetical protein